MSTEKPPDDRKATVPEPADRFPITLVAPPHPALVADAVLLAQCDLRFQRRSGPGGQHRNKTSSGVFLHHEPTGIVAEATERRSQADNRTIALSRLRFRLATEVRTVSVLDATGDENPTAGTKPPTSELGGPVPPNESEIRNRYRSGSLKFRDTNPDRPAVLALVLNDLHAAGGQPSLVGPIWKVSTSTIVHLIKSHPPALIWVNQVRDHHGRGPLR